MTNEQLIYWIEGYLYNNFDIAATTIKNKIKEAREGNTPKHKNTLPPSLVAALSRVSTDQSKTPPLAPHPVRLT